ncbi:MAG: hypothetical protein HYV26_04100 [Candidatus Hydrogenedentes bacterium]|nr:hypothetical protein [Candidatus Hydrogenedentota bacterium]
MDYFLCAELGRSYVYKGYVLSSVAEFYGFWGASAINPFYGEAAIQGVGTVRLKDYSQALNISLPNWPPWVPGPPQATGTAGGDAVWRLREGVERFLVTDINNAAFAAVAQSGLAVLWDTYGSSQFTDNTAGNLVFNHIAGGSNVLYLDGHVEFIRYPGRFPIADSEQVIKENSHYGLG